MTVLKFFLGMAMLSLMTRITVRLALALKWAVMGDAPSRPTSVPIIPRVKKPSTTDVLVNVAARLLGMV